MSPHFFPIIISYHEFSFYFDDHIFSHKNDDLIMNIYLIMNIWCVIVKQFYGQNDSFWS